MLLNKADMPSKNKYLKIEISSNNTEMRKIIFIV